MTDHAKANALSHVESILALIEAYIALRYGEAESVEYEGDTYEDADDLERRVHEYPLSVDVRSGWTIPGEDMEGAEYQILLTTGGPACRIWGELDVSGTPDGAIVQWQDWGTPWERACLFPMPADSEGVEAFRAWQEEIERRDKAVIEFARMHYYGG